MAVSDEHAEGGSVLVGVTRGETLVGHVEEDNVVLLLQERADLLPLLDGGVDAGGVVRARVQHEDGAVLGRLDVLAHAGEVQAVRVLVVVAVGLEGEAGVLGHGEMVGPGGVRHVHGDALAEEARVELERDAASAGARQHLGRDEAVLLERRRVSAIGELDGGIAELLDARDARVLLLLDAVPAALDDALLRLLDGGEKVRLAVVVAVRADTEVHLLLEGVLVVGVVEAQDGVSGAHGHLLGGPAASIARAGGGDSAGERVARRSESSLQGANGGHRSK
mmetsp:Transcript_10598/g.25143  ORF Transcript_10598/g.25143 Transcript_10598/m.25143 type:complete len:279 (-) Transcript_10598:30-866(-)